MQMRDMDGQALVNSYGDMLYRICLCALRNTADAEDAVQEVLLKYMTKAPAFDSEERRKAWLIKVAMNQCRTMQRRASRNIPTDPALLHPPELAPADRRIFRALMQVKEPFRTVLVLYYVEGYKQAEIAKITGTSVSAVKMRLNKGKKLLEAAYGKE
jgi:RNA polymerase sigma-70 factor (ECF subfamily)